MSWAAAKERLHARIDQEIAPMRARYQHLMEHPQEVEAMLLQGAIKARAVATPFMARLRQAVGLRSLAAQSTSGPAKAAKAASAAFKQYRENDGQFYFKLLDAKGALLLQSTGFANPKEAAQVMAQLKAGGASALPACQAFIASVADAAALDEALESLRAQAA
jgi:tryptophanyl-tRNA synthetase